MNINLAGSSPHPKDKPCLFFFRHSFSGWILLLGFFVLLHGISFAQNEESPRVQAFGGYSYTRFDSATFGFPGGSNLNGWNVSVAGNLTRNIGGVAELSGQY